MMQCSPQQHHIGDYACLCDGMCICGAAVVVRRQEFNVFNGDALVFSTNLYTIRSEDQSVIGWKKTALL